MNQLNLIILTALVWNSVGMANAFSNYELAQQAYVAGDFSKMALLLRGVLSENPPQSLQQTALNLLDQAYAANRGKAISTDWKLPVEIKKLSLVHKRLEKADKTTFALKLSGRVVGKNVVRQLQLVKYPNQVVLDKKAKLGEYTEEVENDPTEGVYFEIDGDNEELPASEGLYLINLTLSNGQETNGWVILSNTTASRSPEIYEPKNEAILSTKNPEVRLQDFTSPEYQGFEKRSVWMAVVDGSLSAPWKEVWSLWDGSLPRTSVTVGKESDQLGVKELADGKYRYYVMFREERRLGEVHVGRQSGRTVKFAVKTDK